MWLIEEQLNLHKILCFMTIPSILKLMGMVCMKQKVESGEVTIEHVSTSEQLGHILTKVLRRTKFEAIRN